MDDLLSTDDRTGHTLPIVPSEKNLAPHGAKGHRRWVWFVFLAVAAAGVAVATVALTDKENERDANAAAGDDASLGANNSRDPPADLRQGLVLLHCRTDGIDVYVVDPSSGGLSLIRGTPAGVLDYEDIVGCNRDALDGSLQRVTTRKRVPSGYRWGWTDIASGRFTDVSAEVSAGFSGESKIVEAQFHPQTDEFVYATQEGTVFAITEDLGTARTMDRAPDKIRFLGAHIRAQVFVVPSGFVVGDGDRLISRWYLPQVDGTSAVGGDRECTGRGEGIAMEVLTVSGETRLLPLGIDEGYFCPDPIRPIAWLDDRSVVGIRSNDAYIEGGNQLWIVTFDAGFGTAKAYGLLPENTRRNAWPVPSPDGSQIAFLSRESSETSIFVVPRSGGEPSAVAVLPESMSRSGVVALVDWITEL